MDFVIRPVCSVTNDTPAVIHPDHRLGTSVSAARAHRSWGRGTSVATLACLLGCFSMSAERDTSRAATAGIIPAAEQTGESGNALAFTGVTIVDVTDGRLIPGQTVIISGRRIQAVGPAGKARKPAGAKVVNAGGQYMIPGLLDMHVHLLTIPQNF